MMAGEVAILISTLVKFQDMNQMRGVKLPSCLSTQICSNLVISGPIGLIFSAILPETHTFQKKYRKVHCDGGEGRNLQKIHPRIFVTYTV